MEDIDDEDEEKTDETYDKIVARINALLVRKKRVALVFRNLTVLSAVLVYRHQFKNKIYFEIFHGSSDYSPEYRRNWNGDHKGREYVTEVKILEFMEKFGAAIRMKRTGGMHAIEPIYYPTPYARADITCHSIEALAVAFLYIEEFGDFWDFKFAVPRFALTNQNADTGWGSGREPQYNLEALAEAITFDFPAILGVVARLLTQQK